MESRAWAPHLDVVDHGKPAEQRDVLERARDAEPGAPMGGQIGDVAAVEPDASRRGAVFSRDDVEEAGLPGAIGADHRSDRPRWHCDADVLERMNAAETQEDAFDCEKGI